MFNVGAPEILVILVVALVVLGPARLPEAGRQLGRALAEFRKVRANVQQDLREVLAVDDLRQAFDVRSMLDDNPAGRGRPARSGPGMPGVAGAAVGAAGAALAGSGPGGRPEVTAPDGAPSVPEAALVATPTVAVPPPDERRRDVLLDVLVDEAQPVAPADDAAAHEAS